MKSNIKKINKNNSFEDNKISQNNKLEKEIQFPYINIKSQHIQIKAVFENTNCKNNKKTKDSKKTLPIKLRKGSVDDIKIIKKETNNANNLTTKIQKLLEQPQEKKQFEIKKNFLNFQTFVKTQMYEIKRNKLNKSNSSIKNIQKKEN